MFANSGARDLLLHSERETFLIEHLPAIADTIDRIGLMTKQLRATGTSDEPPTPVVHQSEWPA